MTVTLQGGTRRASVSRVTSETKIEITVDLDGTGKGNITTGIGFFDHMLDQIARHSGIDLDITVEGDLHVDEHHTVEDTAIALGEALRKALGDKRGIERYGFVLPMDDCLCTVAVDFGGRPCPIQARAHRRHAHRNVHALFQVAERQRADESIHTRRGHQRTSQNRRYIQGTGKGFASGDKA